jgi:uncharacterized tellurite resistance protein B-like protein
MSLVTRLIELVGGSLGAPTPDPDGLESEPLAAAALLVHVARVDGSFAEAERDRLTLLLQSRFGLSESLAERLVVRADGLDREVDDVATLVEMMGRSVDREERLRVLGMAYQVAGAHGEIEEFEDDLVWRVGHLLGFTDPEIEAIRADAVPASKPAALAK